MQVTYTSSGNSSTTDTASTVTTLSPGEKEKEEANDATVLDAVVEEEDGVDDDDDAVEESQEPLPNNDFCFTEEDFLSYRSSMNDATRHQGVYKDSWEKIKALAGEEVRVSSAHDGTIVWKVVEGCFDDELIDVREIEDKMILERGRCPITTIEDSDDMNFNYGFWTLWPFKIEEQLEKINKRLDKENKERKGKYQRPIKTVSKKELVMFYALLLAASVFQDNGYNLWSNGATKKRKASFSNKLDFGVYMKLWRFKEIKLFIACIMEEEEMKLTDDWWKARKMLNGFIDKRKGNIFVSHMLVFDESMSAFVPR